MPDAREFGGWAIHKDAHLYERIDDGQAPSGSAPGYLPASQLTPEARERRQAIHARRKAERDAKRHMGDVDRESLLAPVLKPKKD